MVFKFIYKLLGKYETQLENIKKDPSRLKMKESLFNKVGQVLFLHFDNISKKSFRLRGVDEKYSKLSEISSAEKYIGKMGRESKIELTKPFGYDYLTEKYLKDYIEIRKQILKYIPLGSDILDLGCGAGWLAILLSYEGYNVDGIEISPLLVDIAQKRYSSWHSNGKCNFFVADMENIQFDKCNKKYDLIIIYEALHHAENPDKVITNAMHLCKSSGYILMKEPNIMWTITGIRSGFINENRERGFTKFYLKRLLKKKGFMDITIFKNYFGCFLRDIYVLAKKTSKRL